MPSSPRAQIVFALCLLATLYGTLPATAQTDPPPEPHRRKIAVSGPHETRIPPAGTTVPMPRFQNIPYVEAYVNGKGPYRLVVDTGAPLLGLNNAVADDLKLPATSLGDTPGTRIKVRSPGGDGRPATPRDVDTLKIGNAEFSGVQALASDSPFTSDFDGVLGLAVFRDCLLTFDYPAGELRLAQGTLPPANGRDVLDYETRMGKIVFAADVDGQPFDFTLDTGASAWFVFPKALTKRSKYLHGPVEAHQARTIDRTITVQMARLDCRLQLGRHTFLRPYGLVEGDTDLTVIGSGALDEFALTLDQANRRLRLTRTSDAALTPPPYRTFGFSMRRDGQTITISHVVPKSPAQAAGLQAGDAVVSIADKPAAEVYGRPLMRTLVQQDSVKVRYLPTGATAPRDADIRICELIP